MQTIPTLLVDAVNGTITASLYRITPAIDGSALTGLTYSISPQCFNRNTHHASGYGITDAYTKTEVDNAITSPGTAQVVVIITQ